MLSVLPLHELYMKDKIIEISKKLGHAHIGSSLTAYPIIDEIFALKKPDEKFVLSNGHAGLALALKMGVEYVIENSIHADKAWCDCSTGSLSHGVGIAIGMAMADRTKNVYVLESDGGAQEGSFWECLRIAKEQKLTNLKLYINANGWKSYDGVDVDYLERCIKAFGFPVEFRRTKIDDKILEQYPQLRGLGGHYGKIK
jgi:transketolase N-terminal domain/subunit